jgi:hypothetical protein
LSVAIPITVLRRHADIKVGRGEVMGFATLYPSYALASSARLLLRSMRQLSRLHHRAAKTVGIMKMIDRMPVSAPESANDSTSANILTITTPLCAVS